MGTRLYVGNLPFDVDESQLRTLFAGGGRSVTEVKMVTDRETGRPRGFAFVEMGSQADANAAVQELNGKELGGRALTVNEARERESRGGFGGGRSGGGRSGGGRMGGGPRWYGRQGATRHSRQSGWRRRARGGGRDGPRRRTPGGTRLTRRTSSSLPRPSDAAPATASTWRWRRRWTFRW